MRNVVKQSMRQLGLTLVETIVAVLLVASGVIGIAAIYAQQQNTARGGRLHEHAVKLAQQIATQIAHDDTPEHNFETALGVTCAKQPAKLSDPLSVDITNLVACWQDRVEQELTNGTAYITVDRNTVPPQYVIVVNWSEPRSGTASYVLRVVQGGSVAAKNNVSSATARTDAARAAG